MKNLIQFPILIFIFLFLSNLGATKFNFRIRIINSNIAQEKNKLSLYINQTLLFSYKGLWQSNYYSFNSNNEISISGKTIVTLKSSDNKLIISTDYSFLSNIDYSVLLFEKSKNKGGILIFNDFIESIPEPIADKARWRIINLSKKYSNLNIFTQVEDCYKCLYLYTTNSKFPNSQKSVATFVNTTKYNFYTQIFDENNNQISHFLLNIKENGFFTFFLLDNNYNGLDLKVIVEKSGNKSWVPLVVCISIIIALLLLRILALFLYKKYKEMKKRKEKIDNENYNKLKEGLNKDDESIEKSKIEEKPIVKARVASLDVFRGKKKNN